MRGPLKFEFASVRGGAQALVTMELRQFVGEAHVTELFDRAGCEAVAAGLLAWEGLLVDHHHVETVAGQPVARRRAGRTGSDHQDVVMGSVTDR